MDQIDAIIDVCMEGRLEATQNDPSFENFNGILGKNNASFSTLSIYLIYLSYLHCTIYLFISLTYLSTYLSLCLVVDKIVPTGRYGHKISFGTGGVSGRSSGELEDR